MRIHTSTIRSGVLLSAIATLMAFAAACVQVEQILTLDKDGSGTLLVSYGMSKGDLARMQEMSKQAFAEEGAATDEEAFSMFDFNEEDIREDFKAYEAQGVTLDSVRTEESNGWKFVHLAIRFKSLEGLSRTEFISDRNMSLVHEGGSNYVFRQTAAQANGDQAETGPEAEAMEEAMAEMMKGFRAVMTVKTPGRILSSNADRSDDTSATWEFDLSKDPKALKRAQKLDLQVQFDGAGLALPEFKPAGGG